ncbi:hypothetical protein D3C72_2023000 [compost metagenome]
MDRTAGDDFRTRCDRADHGDVAFRKDHRLSGTNRLPDDDRRCCSGRRRFLADDGDRIGCLRFSGDQLACRSLEIRRRSAASHRGRHARLEQRGTPALDAEDPDVSLGEFVEQALQLRPVDVEIDDIEHHRPAEKKARRARGQIVEPRQPRIKR